MWVVIRPGNEEANQATDIAAAEAGAPGYLLAGGKNWLRMAIRLENSQSRGDRIQPDFEAIMAKREANGC